MGLFEVEGKVLFLGLLREEGRQDYVYACAVQLVYLVLLIYIRPILT